MIDPFGPPNQDDRREWLKWDSPMYTTEFNQMSEGPSDYWGLTERFGHDEGR